MNHPFLKAFGNRIKELRNQKGYSQEHLAQIAELDRTYISGVERGLRNVSLINLERLSKALEVKPEALLEFSSSSDS